MKQLSTIVAVFAAMVVATPANAVLVTFDFTTLPFSSTFPQGIPGNPNPDPVNEVPNVFSIGLLDLTVTPAKEGVTTPLWIGHNGGTDARGIGVFDPSEGNSLNRNLDSSAIDNGEQLSFTFSSVIAGQWFPKIHSIGYTQTPGDRFAFALDDGPDGGSAPDPVNWRVEQGASDVATADGPDFTFYSSNFNGGPNGGIIRVRENEGVDDRFATRSTQNRIPEDNTLRVFVPEPGNADRRSVQIYVASLTVEFTDEEAAALGLVSVPVPPAFGFLAAGLASLAWFRRRTLAASWISRRRGRAAV
ncbi:MAG: hypothetical protein AAF416_04720 [Pseudomonadota bacterium]